MIDIVDQMQNKLSKTASAKYHNDFALPESKLKRRWRVLKNKKIKANGNNKKPSELCVIQNFPLFSLPSLNLTTNNLLQL